MERDERVGGILIETERETGGYGLLLRSDFMNEFTALGVLIRLIHLSRSLIPPLHVNQPPDLRSPFFAEGCVSVLNDNLLFILYADRAERRKKDHYNNIFK